MLKILFDYGSQKGYLHLELHSEFKEVLSGLQTGNAQICFCHCYTLRAVGGKFTENIERLTGYQEEANAKGRDVKKKKTYFNTLENSKTSPYPPCTAHV